MARPRRPGQLSGSPSERARAPPSPGGNFGRKLRGEGGGAAGARVGDPESRTPRAPGRNRRGPGDRAEWRVRPAAFPGSSPRRALARPASACAWARASASPWRSPPAPRCGRPDTRVPSAPAGAGRGRGEARRSCAPRPELWARSPSAGLLARKAASAAAAHAVPTPARAALPPRVGSSALG